MTSTPTNSIFDSRGSVVTIGESMALIRGDGIGGLEHLAAARIETGGAEGNVAVGLTRLGVPTTWLGRVGDDALGRRVAGELRGEGVRVVAIVDASAPTGLMIKNTPHAGRTAVTYYRAGSAGSRLAPSDLDSVDFAEHSLLHLTGITPALSGSARDTAFEAIDRARTSGCAVSFDVNMRASLWTNGEAVPVLRALASLADIVIAGEDEAALITGVRDASIETALTELRNLGPREAVLKRGPAGVSASASDDVLHQPSFVVPVVDTVGAGDASTAAYLARRVKGAPLSEALFAAAVAGAIACTHPSDWLGAARPTDIAAFASKEPVNR